MVMVWIICNGTIFTIDCEPTGSKASLKLPGNVSSRIIAVVDSGGLVVRSDYFFDPVSLPEQVISRGTPDV